jgi:hypothetical protein
MPTERPERVFLARQTGVSGHREKINVLGRLCTPNAMIMVKSLQ